MLLSAKFKSCAAAAAVLAACLLLPGNQAKAEAAPTPARKSAAQLTVASAPQTNRAQTPRYLPAVTVTASNAQQADEPAAPAAEEALPGEDAARESAVPESGIALATKADLEAPDDLVKLGDFIATAYCVTGTTATGTQTTVGQTLAVNPYVIPYGTEVWLYLEDGSFAGDFIAEDTGANMLANSNVIDIYMGQDSYNDCILWGAQNVSVYIRASDANAAADAES